MAKQISIDKPADYRKYSGRYIDLPLSTLAHFFDNEEQAYVLICIDNYTYTENTEYLYRAIQQLLKMRDITMREYMSLLSTVHEYDEDRDKYRKQSSNSDDYIDEALNYILKYFNIGVSYSDHEHAILSLSKAIWIIEHEPKTQKLVNTKSHEQ